MESIRVKQQCGSLIIDETSLTVVQRIMNSKKRGVVALTDTRLFHLNLLRIVVNFVLEGKKNKEK